MGNHQSECLSRKSAFLDMLSVDLHL